MIDACLAPLNDLAVEIVLCNTSNRSQVLLHIMLISSVAYTLDTGDLFGLNRGSDTAAPCYLFTAKQSTISVSANAELTIRSGTKQVLELRENAKKHNLESKLSKLSMLPVRTVLHEFPMVGEYPFVDIYAVLRL